MIKASKFLQGVVAIVLVSSIFAAERDTPDYAYHHRSYLWVAGCLIFLLLALAALMIFPYDRGITPLVLGLYAGSSLAMVISFFESNKAVEDYWTITKSGYDIYFCLSDVAIILCGCYIILRLLVILYFSFTNVKEIEIQKA